MISSKSRGGKARQDFEGLIAAFEGMSEGVEVPQVHNSLYPPSFLGIRKTLETNFLQVAGSIAPVSR